MNIGNVKPTSLSEYQKLLPQRESAFDVSRQREAEVDEGKKRRAAQLLTHLYQSPEFQALSEPEKMQKAMPLIAAINPSTAINLTQRGIESAEIAERQLAVKELSVLGDIEKEKVKAELKAKDLSPARASDWIRVKDPNTKEEHLVNKKTNEVKSLFDIAGIKIDPEERGTEEYTQAVDYGANVFIATKKMPVLGRGALSNRMRIDIVKKAAELDPGNTIVYNKELRSTSAAALNKLKTQFATSEAFADTARANLSVLHSTLEGLPDTQSPLLNKGVRTLLLKAVGSPSVSAHNAGVDIAVAEVARVLNSSTGAGGVISDTARKEMQQLIAKDATKKQIEAVMDIFERDLLNRKTAYLKNISVWEEAVKEGGKLDAATLMKIGEDLSNFEEKWVPSTVREGRKDEKTFNVGGFKVEVE